MAESFIQLSQTVNSQREGRNKLILFLPNLRNEKRLFAELRLRVNCDNKIRIVYHKQSITLVYAICNDAGTHHDQKRSPGNLCACQSFYLAGPSVHSAPAMLGPQMRVQLFAAIKTTGLAGNRT